MINYTERIALLMEDVCRRSLALRFIDLKEVLVFGRFGRSHTEGAFATCHCLTLPRASRVTTSGGTATPASSRALEWFVTKSPEVRIGGRRSSI